MSDNGRPLTSGEIKLAQSIFGSSIDLSSITVINSNFMPGQPGGTLMTPNGSIYSPNASVDFSLEGTAQQAVFIHELVHVWQYQQGENVLADGIGLIAKYGLGYAVNAYKYDITEITSFSSLNIEQQAGIVEDYYRVSNGLAPRYETSGDMNPEDYRSIIPDNIVKDFQFNTSTLPDNPPLPPVRPPEFSKCFAAGTPITLASGMIGPIEAIKAGSEVWAFDSTLNGGCGPLMPRRVKRLFTSVTRERMFVTGRDPIGREIALTVTPGHRFLTSKGKFERIDDILASHKTIVLADASVIEVKADHIVYSEKTAHLYEQAELVINATDGCGVLAPQIELGNYGDSIPIAAFSSPTSPLIIRKPGTGTNCGAETAHDFKASRNAIRSSPRFPRVTPLSASSAT